eukprot:14776201-Alexandrium_andersonii.AAC.1
MGMAAKCWRRTHRSTSELSGKDGTTTIVRKAAREGVSKGRRRPTEGSVGNFMVRWATPGLPKPL